MWNLLHHPFHWMRRCMCISINSCTQKFSTKFWRHRIKCTAASFLACVNNVYSPNSINTLDTNTHTFSLLCEGCCIAWKMDSMINEFTSHNWKFDMKHMWNVKTVMSKRDSCFNISESHSLVCRRKKRNERCSCVCAS